jgi:hypothetical protein
MSASFYHHYLEFFLGFIEIMLGALITVECVTLFFITHSGWFLTGFSVSTMATLFYCLRYLQKFRDFEGKLELYFPRVTKKDEEAESQTQIDKIVAENSEIPLKTCKLFAQDLTYGEIKRQLGLSHPQQAKRLIQRGIKQLLENGEKNV